MIIINRNTIDGWPEGVFLGISDISEKVNTDGLTNDEKNEFRGFNNLKRKAEFVSVRNLFRFVAEQMGLDSNLVQLKKEATGKPYAITQGRKIFVSFSHSKNQVFCAVSEKWNIGLDAEPVERSIGERLMKRILNEEETKLLTSEDPIKLWTMKEAVVKCLGTGLRTNLNDITIAKIKKNRFSGRFNNDICYEICSFKRSDHQIALAYHSKND